MKDTANNFIYFGICFLVSCGCVIGLFTVFLALTSMEYKSKEIAVKSQMLDIVAEQTLDSVMKEYEKRRVRD